jgi:hypothetical protein
MDTRSFRLMVFQAERRRREDENPRSLAKAHLAIRVGFSDDAGIVRISTYLPEAIG